MAERNSREVQDLVRGRLDERGWKVLPSLTPRQVVDTIVWETLAVLGEWGLIEMEIKEPPKESP